MKQMAFAIFILALLSTHCFAGLACKGSVTYSYVEGEGDLSISSSEIFGGVEGRKICNTNTNPITCSLWASYIASSITNGKNIGLYYPVDNSVYNCSNVSSLPTILYLYNDSYQIQ